MIYTIKKIFLYSEEVEVEADSEDQALDEAMVMDGERNYDDSLQECLIINTRKGEQP